MTKQYALNEKTLCITESVSTEYDLSELIRQRDLYKASVESEQARLDAIEEKIAEAKKLGFVEEEASE